MVVSGGRIANEVFLVQLLQVARHDFAFCEGSKRSRIANLATKFTHDTAALQVVRVESVLASICIGSSGLVRSSESGPRLFGRTNTSIQRHEARWIELSASLDAAQRTSTGRSANPECQDQGCSSENVASPPLLRGASGS